MFRNLGIVGFALLGLGVALVMIGDWLASTHESLSMAQRVGLGLEHLGIGFFAVTLLKFTIEKIAEKEFFGALSSEVKTQVRSSLQPLENFGESIKRELGEIENQLKPLQSLTYKISRIAGDERLRTMLERNVFNPNFIRPYCNLTLNLEPLEHRDDLLKASVTLEYEVKNIANEERAYTVTAWLDDIIKLEEAGGKSVAGFTEVCLPDSLVISDLEKKGVIYREGGMIYLNKPENKIKPDESLHCMIKGTQIMRKADHFVWNLVTLTERMNIFIGLSGGLDFQQLNVSPHAMHHIDHDDFMKSRDTTTPSVWKFAIDHIIRPYQGVEIRWMPNSA